MESSGQASSVHVVPNACNEAVSFDVFSKLKWSGPRTNRQWEMENAFTTQHIFIKHINKVYTIHSLERGWGLVEHEERADNHLRFTKKTDCFFSEKKNLLNICILAPNHISCMTSKIVTLPPSPSFFPIISKQGHSWSKVFNWHRPWVLMLLCRGLKATIELKWSAVDEALCSWSKCTSGLGRKQNPTPDKSNVSLSETASYHSGFFFFFYARRGLEMRLTTP